MTAAIGMQFADSNSKIKFPLSLILVGTIFNKIITLPIVAIWAILYGELSPYLSTFVSLIFTFYLQNAIKRHAPSDDEGALRNHKVKRCGCLGNIFLISEAIATYT